jgi:hypothetical protein
MKRTPQEETVRQLKILNGTLNPMGAFFKLACWIVGIFVILCLLIKH